MSLQNIIGELEQKIAGVIEREVIHNDELLTKLLSLEDEEITRDREEIERLEASVKRREEKKKLLREEFAARGTVLLSMLTGTAVDAG